MLASDIQPGDYLPDTDSDAATRDLIGLPPTTIYTVIDKEDVPEKDGEPAYVRARVRFTVDGGTDTRTWFPTDQVPLVRPEPVGTVEG